MSLQTATPRPADQGQETDRSTTATIATWTGLIFGLPDLVVGLLPTQPAWSRIVVAALSGLAAALVLLAARAHDRHRLSREGLVCLVAIIGLLFALVVWRPWMRSTAGTPAAATASSPATSGASSPKLRTSGVVQIGARSTATDLDSQPPKAASNVDHADMQYTSDGNTIRPMNGAAAALWTDLNQVPGRDTCEKRARTGTDRVVLEPGAVVCVRTNEGRIALLRLKTAGGVGKLPTFDATVWEW